MLLRQLRGQYLDEERERRINADARRTFPYVSGRVDAPDKVIRQCTPSRNQRFCDGGPENLPHLISYRNSAGAPKHMLLRQLRGQYSDEMRESPPVFRTRRVLVVRKRSEYGG